MVSPEGSSLSERWPLEQSEEPVRRASGKLPVCRRSSHQWPPSGSPLGCPLHRLRLWGLKYKVTLEVSSMHPKLELSEGVP